MDLRNSDVTVNSTASEAITQMRKKNRRARPYDLFLGLMLIVVGGVFFFLLNISIVDGAWKLPFAVFTLYVSIFLLLCVTAGVRKVAVISSFCSLLPSLVFLPSFFHAICVVVAGLIVWRSVAAIRRSLFESVTVRAGHAMHAGIMIFVLALSLVVSSQYFWTVKGLASSDLVVRVAGSDTLPVKIADAIFARMGKGSSDGITGDEGTVDAFLRGAIQSQSDGIAPEENGSLAALAKNVGIDPSVVTSVTDSAGEVFEEALLRRARESLSTNIGQKLDGSEGVVDVMTTFAQLRLQKLIDANSAISSALPVILTVFLFITLYSVGSLLRYPWIWIASLFFWLLKVYGFVKVIRVQKNVEVIKF